MSLALTIKAMVAAGCSVEQIAAVADQFAERDRDAVAAKRAKDAERKRKSRASAMSRGQTVTPRTACDIADNPASREEYNTTRAQTVIPVGISNDIPPIEVNPQLPTVVTPPKSKSPSTKEILSEVVSEKTASDVIAHRKALRKPLTPRAAELLAKSLAASGDAEHAAATMIERGWQGYRADWDTPHSNARAGPADRDYGKGALTEMLMELNKRLEDEPDRRTEGQISGGNVFSLPVVQGDETGPCRDDDDLSPLAKRIWT